MKKALLIIVTVCAVVCAYFVGRSHGRSTGYEDGAIRTGQNADMCKGLRAMAILGVLEQTNYTRVAEALNHDIDYAILGVLKADKHLKNTCLPHNTRKQEESDSSGYRVFAEFRRNNPTKSTDKHIVEAVNELLNKY